jgi:hypothetical protein
MATAQQPLRQAYGRSIIKEAYLQRYELRIVLAANHTSIDEAFHL